jgi:hypothetical protein
MAQGRKDKSSKFYEQINSKVPRVLVHDCIGRALELVGLESLAHKIIQVGSLYKEEMGDIDLSLDRESFLKFLDFDFDPDRKVLFEKVESYLESLNTSIPWQCNAGFDQFHIAMPLIQDDKSKIIQVDFIIGDNQWTKDILVQNRSENDGIEIHDIDNNPMICGPAHRQTLLSDIASQQTEEMFDGSFKRLLIDTRTGLYNQHYYCNLGKKKKEISRDFISNDVNDIAHSLFGPSVFWKDIDSCHKVFNHLKETDLLRHEDKVKAIQQFVTGVKKKKIPVPYFVNHFLA